MDMTRADMIRDYLASLDGVPVTWGVNDCCMMLANWLALCGVTVNPPAYSGEAEGRAIMAGGLLPLIEDIATDAGLRETGAPVLGDVGLVEMSFGPVGCIFLNGGHVAVRTTKGVNPMFMPRNFIAAWSVP